jgi:hypothetical protein
MLQYQYFTGIVSRYILAHMSALRLTFINTSVPIFWFVRLFTVLFFVLYGFQ